MPCDPRVHVFYPTATHPALGVGQVHLWLARLDTHDEPHPASLAADEWLRAARFHFAADRERFIASRIALRRILAGYAGTEPAALTFTRGPHGKPSLPGSTLRFNLSHSRDVMLLAVTHAREVGVDVEALRSDMPFEMLTGYFSPEDQWTLRTTPEAVRAEKFFELWTRGEAQIKARGLSLDDTARARDDAFTLHSLRPADGYAAALAIEGRGCTLTCLQWLN